MKPTKLTILVALLLLNLGQALWADTNSNAPTVTVHQKLAGDLDNNGWATAVSTEGGYLVRVPTKYNDITAVQTKPDSLIERSHTIAALTMQGVKFTATRIHYRPGNNGARKQFDKLKVSAGKLRYKSMKPMKMNGNEAIEGEVVTARATLVQRAILLGEDLFLMIVEYPKAQEAIAKPQIATFFESVKLD